MADNGERRMLFDTRGRRKNVIRVVYAVLALLMGGSLFLTVGGFNIAEVFDSGSTGDATEVFHEQSERIEGRLAKNPNDEALLLSLTRARIQAGNAQAEIDPQTGLPGPPPPEASEDFDRAREAWSRYLKQAGDDPNPAAAQLVAGTFFRLAESGTSLLETQEDVAEATKAQLIAAEERPNVGSLTTLAIYQYFNGEFAAGDKTLKRAVADASKPEAKAIESQLAKYRKNAEQYDQRKRQLLKTAKKLEGEQLQSPFEGLGPGAPPPGG
jgi:hypothetical protein